MKSKSATILYPTTDQKPFDFGFSSHDSLHDSMYDIHYELELGVVMSGRMRREWDTEARLLQPGNVWMTGVWEAHGFELVEAPCRVAVFLVRPELMSTIQLGVAEPRWLASFMASPTERPQLLEADGAFFLAAINRLEQRTGWRAGQIPSDNDLLAAYLLLLEMLHALGEQSRPYEPRSDGNIWSRIQPALSAVFATRMVIREHDAAIMCHMSDSTFRRNFVRATGVPFGKFALHHRLKSASLELTGARSIEQISERWGFTDISHFYKAFKQVFKQTPAAYRAEQRSIASLPKG